MTEVPAGSARSAGSRSLSTARAVLQVLSFLGRHPAGVRADEVAKVLGKSVSTAYYLLTSLCEEGYAVHEPKGLYRLVPAFGVANPPAEQPADAPGDLSHAVDELFLKTHHRSYLALIESGRIEIKIVRGRQGMPRLPGHGAEIRDEAHALALGKVVLARLRAAGLERYVGRGLRAFTRNTITRPPVLATELEEVRTNGFAIDREEFDLDFCCIAAAVLDARGRFVAAIGLSTSARQFESHRTELVEAVSDAAHTAAVGPRLTRAEPQPQQTSTGRTSPGELA